MKLREISIADLLKEKSEKFGDKLFIDNPEYTCTYRELDYYTDIVAKKLLDDGVNTGEHVGIWANNSYKWIIIFLAITKIGALACLYNNLYGKDGMQSILEYSETKIVFTDKAKTDEGLKLIEQLKEDTSLKIFDIDEYFKVALDKNLSYNFQSLKERSVDCKNSYIMMFTSGTTSMPKGVILSQYSLINNAFAIAGEMHWNSKDKLCLAVPLFHCFGITASLLAAISVGASLYLPKDSKTLTLWASILEYECTILNGVPSMFLAMVSKSEYDTYESSSLKSGIIAGSPITKDEYVKISTKFKNAKIQPSYGQTEASPCISIADFEDTIDIKSSSAGHVIEHMDIRIADISSDNIYYQSEEDKMLCNINGRCVCGEIQVRGYNIMKGYYKHEKDLGFTKDGWLQTGDIGFMDENNNLHVTGRLKEMIIRAGENISPYEIEEELSKIKGIKELKVVGVKIEVLQEEIVACIVASEETPSDEEIKMYLKSKLAYYKVPSRIIRMTTLPKTTNGKINIGKLKEMIEKSK